MSRIEVAVKCYIRSEQLTDVKNCCAHKPSAVNLITRQKKNKTNETTSGYRLGQGLMIKTYNFVKKIPKKRDYLSFTSQP